MAEVRTQLAVVDRIVGTKGVAIVETIMGSNDREWKTRMTVWLGDGHGLRKGDKARFYGQLSVRTREYNDKTYADISLSNGQVLEGTLERAPQEDATAGSWVTATPGETSAWNAAKE